MKKISTIFLLLLGAVLPTAVLAQSDFIEIPNPIQAAPANSPSATVIDVVFAAFGGFAGLFAILAFGFMIFSAFQIIVSTGNEESITKGKQGFTWSVLSFFIAIFSFSIIAAVHDILGGTGVDPLDNPDDLALQTKNYEFLGTFKTILQGITQITMVAALVMIVYAGIKMIISRGNEEQVTKAKTLLKWAVVGLVLMILSYAIIAGINNMFI